MANTDYTPAFKTKYLKEIAPDFKTEYGLKNINQVPKVRKIVINSGLGKAKDDKKLLEVATNTIVKITGQSPIQTKAKKSIAAFKLREGNVVGLKVTLRGDRMYEFLERLINLVLPRLRDFHGVKNSAFDKNGNYSIGFIDQSVFPELSFEETTTAHPLQVNIVFNTNNKELTKGLLEKFGMPFEKENK